MLAGRETKRWASHALQFSPRNAFQTAKENGVQEQQSGWREQTSISAPEPAAVLGQVTGEEGTSQRRVSRNLQGVSLSPCPNTKLHLCRATLCVHWLRIAIGRLWDKWRFQKEPSTGRYQSSSQPEQETMLNNLGIPLTLARPHLRIRATLALEWERLWHCHNKAQKPRNDKIDASVNKLPTGTSSTFLRGRQQNLYSLTTRHPLSKQILLDKQEGPNGNSRSENYMLRKKFIWRGLITDGILQKKRSVNLKMNSQASDWEKIFAFSICIWQRVCIKYCSTLSQ